MVKTRNYEIARGVNAFSRAAMSRRSAKYKFSKKAPVAAKKAPAAAKAPKFYPADDVKVPKKRNFTPKTAKLRSSIKPGQVLVVLSGRFRGKRVVFLKQLESGLLLVTGPYKVNGVPMRRLNQAYVIATSTQVDVSAVQVPANVNDAYFKRPAAKKSKGEDAFYAQESDAKVSDQRKADQKSVDKALLAALKKTPLMKQYLNAKFSLKAGQYPHLMKF